MAPRSGNGIDELRNVVFELRGTVLQFMSHRQVQDARANEGSLELTRSLDKLSGEVRVAVGEVVILKESIKDVQQDVAEMKNADEVHKQKIEEIEKSRPLVVTMIGDVATLNKFKKDIEDQRLYDSGYWAAIKKIGVAGWTIISAVLCVSAAVFVQYGWPYIVDFLRRP